MTAVIEPDASRAELLRSSLAGSVLVASLDRLDTHLATHPNETVVVLGPSVSMEDAVAVAQAQRVARPALGVLLVRSRIDSTLLSEALRAGIREVIDARELTEVGEAVHRARTLGERLLGDKPQAAPDSRGKLVTVFSTKGGVGKSTIATNLAVALAEAEHRVCVVDLDVEAGDVAVMLRLFPTATLARLGDLRGAITSDSVAGLITEHPSGVGVIAAPVGAETREQISTEDIGRLLECLKSMYDVVIVDTSGNFDEPALQAFDHTDLLVLVATLDIPALKNLKVAVGTLDLLNQDRERWRLVVNRADDSLGLSVAEFQDTIGVDIVAKLPSSPEVLSCVNKGEAIVAAKPRHKLSKTLRAFAEAVAAELIEGADAPAAAAVEDNGGGPKRRRGRRTREKVAE